jgi:hypothetical protein
MSFFRSAASIPVKALISGHIPLLLPRGVEKSAGAAVMVAPAAPDKSAPGIAVESLLTIAGIITSDTITRLARNTCKEN